jgi:hypothetical protein
MPFISLILMKFHFATYAALHRHTSRSRQLKFLTCWLKLYIIDYFAALASFHFALIALYSSSPDSYLLDTILLISARIYWSHYFIGRLCPHVFYAISLIIFAIDALLIMIYHFSHASIIFDISFDYWLHWGFRTDFAHFDKCMSILLTPFIPMEFRSLAISPDTLSRARVRYLVPNFYLFEQ